MKLFTKLFNTLVIILCLTSISYAQTNWVGEYFFGEDGGKTAGGSKIYIAHTIKITEKDGKLDSHIYSQGFQTSRDIYADVKTEGNKIMFYFREKGEDQHTGTFEKGDLLLTLERTEVDGKTKILTSWGTFSPTLESNEKSGEVYFKVSKNENEETTEWIRMETKNKEVSFSIPSNFTYFQDKDGSSSYDSPVIKFRNLHSITSFGNGVSMWMESYDVENGRVAFLNFPHFEYIPNNQKTDYVIGEYSLRQIKTENPYYASYYYFHSEKKFYILGVGARDKNNPEIKTFLQSIKFNGKNILVSEETKTNNHTKVLILEQQKMSPIGVSYEYFNPTANLLNPNQNFEFVNTSAFNEKSFNNSPIIILTKPKPGFTEEAKYKEAIGEVHVKVIFLSNGLIPNMTFVKGLPYGLNDKVIGAVRRIRFLPAERNGKPYSIIKMVVFHFQVY